MDILDLALWLLVQNFSWKSHSFVLRLSLALVLNGGEFKRTDSDLAYAGANQDLLHRSPWSCARLKLG